MKMQIDPFLDYLKKQYELVATDILIAEATKQFESEVTIENPAELAAAIDSGIVKGHTIGKMEGKLLMIQEIFGYLKNVIQNQKNNNPEM